MKHALAKRVSVLSATLAPTMVLTLVCSGFFLLTASATNPSWWSTPGLSGSPSAVMAPQVVTNDGVVSTNYAPNDYAVVTQGQLKHFTARAVDEMNLTLTNSGGAGATLSNLTYGWHQDYATNNYATNTDNPYKPADLQIVNVGQLKYIASLVYDQLTNSGYMVSRPNWIQQNTNTDTSAANLGQLKQIFNFDPTSPATPANLVVSISGTQAALSWTDSFTLIGSYTIEYSTNGGSSWSVLATVPGNATTYTATNLTLGTNYSFEVKATNPSGSSAASSSDAGPVITLATPSGAILVQ